MNVPIFQMRKLELKEGKKFIQGDTNVKDRAKPLLLKQAVVMSGLNMNYLLQYTKQARGVATVLPLCTMR